MKKNGKNVCPGCSRRCSADNIRCKRGREYFRQCAAEETCSLCSKKHKYKWEKYVSEEGMLRRLLVIARGIKRALRGGMVREEQIMEALNEQEWEQLAGLLKKLEGFQTVFQEGK